MMEIFGNQKEMLIIPSSFVVISLKPFSGIDREIFQALQVIIIVLKKWQLVCANSELCTFIGNMQIRAYRKLYNNGL